jgi:oligopeptide/dipeptide ABC transporter ATP-binding protein
MYLGTLVEVGPSDDIYMRPAHPYTAGLLAAVPTVQAARQRMHTSGTVRGELPSAVDPPSGCRFRTRCPRAQDVCAVEMPPLRQVRSSAQQVACHFPLAPTEENGG